MSVWRGILCVLLPPLAVLDKGCGMAMIVGVLWLAGWFPGVIAAVVINLMDSPPNPDTKPRFVEVPLHAHDEPLPEKSKRKGAYVRLADGEMAEVIDDDGAPPDQHTNRRY